MIQIATSRNLDNGITTLELDGELTLPAVPPVRRATGKAAAECPAAVLIDLAKLGDPVPALLSVFATATFEARQHFGVPLLLCGPDARVRRGLAPFRHHLAIYDSRTEAALAVHADVPFWVRRRLSPAPASAKVARDLAGDACAGWGLSHLRERARLIASELASNAIVHAATDFDVVVSFTGRYLRIAVQDGSRAEPRPARAASKAGGHGLYLIDRLATHCGHTELAAGKIVWAMMQAAPR